MGRASYGTIEHEQSSNGHVLNGGQSSNGHILNGGHSSNGDAPNGTKPLAPEADSKLSMLFTSRLMCVLVNHALLAILDHSYIALVAVFLATPITSGGLGLSPSHIGYILGTTGLVHGVLQAFCFAPLYRTFDPKNLYTFCMAMIIPAYACFPFINALARTYGLAYPGLWVLLVFQLFLLLPSYTAFSAYFCRSCGRRSDADVAPRRDFHLYFKLVADAGAAGDHERPRADDFLVHGRDRPGGRHCASLLRFRF